MDVLSQVLRAVKLQGALFFNGEFSAPWSFRSPISSLVVPYLSPDAGHLIMYHYLMEGRAYARLPEGPREELAAGDIVIFPHGDSHILGNGSPERPVDALKTFGKNLTQGLKLARFGGGGDITRFVCGYMTCDSQLSDVLLSGLPKLLKVHVAGEPAGQWLQHSIRFSVHDEDRGDAGSSVVLAKLSELLFIETLRRFINTLPSDQVGWLAGARDPLVGKALALMHKDPAHPWTIASIARSIGLSRTALVQRFRHYLGDSPMAYLAQWRLKLGAEILRSTEESVAEVAAIVGYGSEASFNRAFKREFDCPPAQFRRHSTVALSLH